jgi:hypothetical protein
MHRVCLCFALAAGALAHVPAAAADDRACDPRQACLDEMPETLPSEPIAAADDDEHVEVLPELDDADTGSDSESRPLPFRFEGSLQGMIAVPMAGERGDTTLGYGITYGVGYGALPLLLGVDFMSASNGDASNISLPATADAPALLVRKTSENRTLYFDLWLRVQPLHWPVRPYVEGFIGRKLAQARYSLIRSGASGEAQTVSAQDWSTSLGFGAGVDFAGLLHLADALSLTLGIRRLQSSHVVFSARADIEGRAVATQSDIASAVWLLSLGIVAWYDLGAPKNDANF